MLLTADCLPVSFYDPVTQTIALAHFSRETISKMLPQKTVGFLREHFSVDPPNLLIAIGPHIHTDSYSFPLPQSELPPTIAPFTKTTASHIHIDLVSACNHQLIQEGVLIENISVSDVDTTTSPEHFSHYQSKEPHPKGDGTRGSLLAKNSASAELVSKPLSSLGKAYGTFRDNTSKKENATEGRLATILMMK
jgi:copper oxidase (laccase) domain-containing protein